MPKSTELYNWVCTVYGLQWYHNKVEKLRYCFKMILCIIYFWSTFVSLFFFLYLKAIKCHFRTDSEYCIYHLHSLFFTPDSLQKEGVARAFAWREESQSNASSPLASCLALGNFLNFSETLTCHLTHPVPQPQAPAPGVPLSLPATPFETPHEGLSPRCENGSFFTGLQVPHSMSTQWKRLPQNSGVQIN